MIASEKAADGLGAHLDYPSGYDRKKVAERIIGRQMLVAEAKTLNYGAELWFVSNDGRARRCRVSGAPKVWKTRPGDVRVPVKYGMFESGAIVARDDGTCVVEGTSLPVYSRGILRCELD